MFKYKDRRAMNSNDFVVLPNSAAKSVKLNARNLQGLKMETGSLAQESDEMEEKLMRLKERMSQEKEERAQSGSCRWKSGQQRPLNNATTLINPRRTKDSRLQKLSAGKVKIRVLQDEPLTAQPRPPSPAAPAPKPAQKSKLKGITCGQCEVRTAGVKCAECSEDYCVGCFSKFHQKGALKFHSIIPIQTELQTHVSARDVVSSSSLQTPPNPSCYPATFSSPNPRPNSTHNHSASSDAFTDQRPANAFMAQHALIQDSSSQILIVHPEEHNNLKSETEPSLLNGTYDEEESAKSFQDALRQWREAGPTTAQEPMWTPPRSVTVADVPTQADLSPGGGGAGGRVPVRVEFSEHGLTLLDRLLLKKHRRNPIELPPLTDPHVKPLPKSPEKDPEASLTAEDEEVHTYLTSLFAVPTNAERYGLDNSTPGACLAIEVLDEEDRAVDVVAKRTVNRIIPSHPTATPKYRTSKSPCPRTTPQLILSREIGETETSLAVCSGLSSEPEPTVDTQGDRRASIKTASSKSTKTRSQTSHGVQSRIESPLSPALSSSAPLYRPPKPSSSPFSFRPNDSPSASRSLTSEECNSYPKISPALRTTFTLTPSSSVDAALLPKISLQKPSGSDVKSSKLFQHSLLDLDAVQSDDDSPISPSPSKLSSRSGCAESLRQSVALSTTRSRLSGDTGVCRTLQHETTGRESMSKQREQHFLSDLSLNDNSSVLTGRHEAMSTGYAKESTFALIREYHNALRSIQDSDDDMSSDSLDLALCDEDSDDEDSGAQARSHRRSPADDRASPASARPAHCAPGPAREKEEEEKRDLPADEAQQLSGAAQVIHSWSDSGDSSDDTPSPLSDISPHFRRKSFDAVHQNRTSLDSSTSTELSEAEMREMSGIYQSGCEDPDMEADTTEHTVLSLERELRMLVRESGSEVFTVAPGNSRTENPRGNRLYTRRMSREDEDEEEAMQNDQKSVLLLP